MGVSQLFCHGIILILNFLPVIMSMEDAAEVTWAHAVNNRAQLMKELQGPVNFLEADVSVGHVIGRIDGPAIPIMAHPPEVTSDISLEDWIDVVTAHNASKSVKLDFKSIETVEPSLKLLKSRISELNFTLWLNADVLYGPVNATTQPVKDDRFLLLCNQYFPNAVLSVGWTTEWRPSFPSSWHYEWKHVRKMAEVIKCFGYEHYFPKFTFPVRGIYASRSIIKLQWLLGVIHGSTLTVWSSTYDPLLLEDLVLIRRSFPRDKVYYDIPNRLQESFYNIKDNETFISSHKGSPKDPQWMILTHGSDHTCSSNTFVSNSTVVFGSSLSTAVLLKKLLFADDGQVFKAMGKIDFFIGYDQPAVMTHQLSIIITDVSRFSKNFSDSGQSDFDLSGSDTDVLWKAFNESSLYTFKYDFTKNPSACWIFKIDTTKDQSFQAWALPCDDLGEQKSFDELSSYGKPEISSRKRMVLPKSPFMIAFVSSGDGHAVLYDFEINGKKEEISRAQSVIRSLTLIGLSLVVGYMMKRLLS